MIVSFVIISFHFFLCFVVLIFFVWFLKSLKKLEPSTPRITTLNSVRLLSTMISIATVTFNILRNFFFANLFDHRKVFQPFLASNPWSGFACIARINIFPFYSFFHKFYFFFCFRNWLKAILYLRERVFLYIITNTHKK